VVLGGGAVSYERGTPVGVTHVRPHMELYPLYPLSPSLTVLYVPNSLDSGRERFQSSWSQQCAEIRARVRRAGSHWSG